MPLIGSPFLKENSMCYRMTHKNKMKPESEFSYTVRSSEVVDSQKQLNRQAHAEAETVVSSGYNAEVNRIRRTELT